jgi:hypothetical protein
MNKWQLICMKLLRQGHVSHEDVKNAFPQSNQKYRIKNRKHNEDIREALGMTEINFTRKG